MNERKTVAARDANGQSWWFPVDEARRWPATTLEGGELFRVAGRWALLEMAALLGEPACIVGDEAALAWLTRNGYSPPDELAEYAEKAEAAVECIMPSRRKRKRERRKAEATANGPGTLGGRGQGVSSTLSDLVLLRRAINEDWPVPDNVRRAIVTTNRDTCCDLQSYSRYKAKSAVGFSPHLANNQTERSQAI